MFQSSHLPIPCLSFLLPLHSKHVEKSRLTDACHSSFQCCTFCCQAVCYATNLWRRLERNIHLSYIYSSKWKVSSHSLDCKCISFKHKIGLTNAVVSLAEFIAALAPSHLRRFVHSWYTGLFSTFCYFGIILSKFIPNHCIVIMRISMMMSLVVF